MLVELTVENYRSFQKRVTWSMEPEPGWRARDEEVNTSNVMDTADGPLLRVAGLYGANASGKTNLIRVLYELRLHVLTSASESQAGDGFQFEPFRLAKERSFAPTTVEIVVMIDRTQFRYALTATPTKVEEEGLWLRVAGEDDEVLAFHRKEGRYENGAAWDRDAAVEDRTRLDALHISVAAQFNHPVALQFVEWFRGCHVVNGLSNLSSTRTAALLADPDTAGAVKEMIRQADFGVVDVRVEPQDGRRLPSGLPEDARELFMKHMPPLLVFDHTVSGSDGASVNVSFEAEDESAGTLKIAYLAGPVIDALRTGGVLVIDEFDARLHTLLTMEVVRMFQDPTSNPNNAQLLFASHDTNLLTRCLLRRDQLWFVEKDRRTGSSDLYSLVEVRLDDGRKVRNDRRYEEDYLQGRYGAVPFFGNLRALVGRELAGEPV